MNLIKTLEQLKFKLEDYTISGDDFSMTPKFTDVATGELDADLKPVMVQVDVTPAKPTAEQLQAAFEKVQLKECDIALLINEYLKDKQRDPENDTLNISEGLIHSFNFTHVARPTNAQLLALKDIATAKVDQEKINAEAEAYLAATDWMIIRMNENGQAVPAEVLVKRAQARTKVIR